MMKKILRAVPIAALALLLLAGVLLGPVWYRTSCAKTEVVTSVSSDGRYTLTIYMIGEPEWPFGPTHCRADLFDGPDRFLEHSFSIRDDGAPARPDHFTIVWGADAVVVTASASEQEDQEYIFRFDGTVG